MDSWPLEPLPPAAVDAVRGAIDTIVADVVAAVVAGGSAYADVLAGPEGFAIRMGIEQAARAFVDAVEHGARPSPEAAELWRRLGEVEFQSGRSLDTMRAAFRTGTRAAWRAAADLAAGAGLSTHLLVLLAEAIFVYSDELASGVAEGYLRIQSDEAGELERRRRWLASLLLDPLDHDSDAIARAAELARWPVPRSLAVLAVAGADPPGAITRRLSVDALLGTDRDGAFVVVGDPDGPGRRAELEAAAGGLAAALGPVVAPRDAARSLRWARLALALFERGRIGRVGRAGSESGGGPVRVDEHLAAMIVLQDEELAAELARVRLAGLDRLGPAERERLLETLAAWLGLQRHVPAIAEALHVHPQTVRYRIARLRELLGGAIDSPDARFELELALRARRALTPPVPS
jgi:hypothetical protein